MWLLLKLLAGELLLSLIPECLVTISLFRLLEALYLSPTPRCLLDGEGDMIA